MLIKQNAEVLQDKPSFHIGNLPDMSYPNILTPPSSNEDSPQPATYNLNPSPIHAMSSDSYILPMGVTVSQSTEPFLVIVEQPIDKFRFRYKSEMTGTHGSLCGMNSDRQRKQTYPTVQLFNFDKPVVFRCSIYQIGRDGVPEELKPHAHRLVKKLGKDEVDDPHDALVRPEDGYTFTFHSMGIIHTAKKNLFPELLKKKARLLKEEIARREGKVRDLNLKEEIEFQLQSGCSEERVVLLNELIALQIHSSYPQIKGLAEADSKSINLNIVCLRFDAFQVVNGILYPICNPVYSHGINNLKSALTGELKIVRMDHCTSPAKGGREVFILVERVTKKNIKVRFYEVDDEDNIVWQDYGKFTDLDVHHQYAIVFKTPPYRDPNITMPVKVYIQLERPSDHSQSEPKEFTYISSADNYKPGAKRSRPNYGSSSYDSSSLASDELPVTINNLSINNVSNLYAEELSSADLDRALTNINSEEFMKLFNEFGQEYQSVTIDAASTLKMKHMMKPDFPPGRKTGPASKILIKNITPEEASRTRDALDELKNFIKTRPSNETKVIMMLNHYFNHEHRTNALHVSIKQNDFNSVMFLLKLIYAYKQTHLLNMRNEDSETPLAIAIACNNADIVNNLLLCNVDTTICDAYHNTIFHTGVVYGCSDEILCRLLSLDNVKTLIDRENSEGDTPLNVAIECGNFPALQVLIKGGADINLKHKKNGYTPLRLAMEKESVEMTRYILKCSETNPEIEDFQGLNPLQAAMKRDNENELMQVVTNYMRNNDYNEVLIKSEYDDVDMSDEEVEEKFSVKLENISMDELKDLYKNVKNFSPGCTDRLAEILDASGKWEDLAELLDLGHLMRSGLHSSKSSPTKLLLKIAVETNGASMWEIRDFLENLDEPQAVESMDNMIKSSKFL